MRFDFERAASTIAAIKALPPLAAQFAWHSLYMLAWELRIAYLLLVTGLWIRCSCCGIVGGLLLDRVNLA